MSNPAGEGNFTFIDLGVRLVHLVSGEDLIARTEYDKEQGVYLLTRATSPTIQPKLNEQGQQIGAAMALMPYRPFIPENETIAIRDANVLFTTAVVEQLEKHYIQVTSDIVVADPRQVQQVGQSRIIHG